MIKFVLIYIRCSILLTYEHPMSSMAQSNLKVILFFRLGVQLPSLLSHGQMLRDNETNHKIECVAHFYEILNPEVS